MLGRYIISLYISGVKRMSTMNIIDNKTLEVTSRRLVPALKMDWGKGQAGVIGIVGGSLEYTGAPYFAGISALKVGADLIHIFCAKEAAPVIKSYSPELIVHPLLDDNTAIDKIVPWLRRIDIIVIGPGLGRDLNVFENVEKLIECCRALKKSLVIDADGLFLIATKPEIITDYPGVILTPNHGEFDRLFKENRQQTFDIGQDILKRFGKNCFVVKKDEVDEIFNSSSQGSCDITNSVRRCGGQGDLLSGSLAVFYNWALKKEMHETNIFAACYAACKLTRECNARAFKTFGRSMTTSDMVQEIGGAFKDNFEDKFEL